MNGLPVPKSPADFPDNPEYEYPNSAKEVLISSPYLTYKESFSPLIKDWETEMSAIIERAYCDRSYHPYRIGDVIEQISERNKDKSIDMVLSVSNKQGFINQS